MTQKRRILKRWVVVNWHYILDKIWNKVFFKCWRCWSLATKMRSNLYKNDWCSNCAMGNQKSEFSLRTKCWILWLYLPTIKSRIQRWWKLKEALYQDKRVLKESFNEKDLSYISKFYSESHEVDKTLEDKAYLKYKIIKI